MNAESFESINPLRKNLENMNSPLSKLIKEMKQDRSLERIDQALNDIGEPWGVFELIENEADAKKIFEEIKAFTNIDEQKEANRKMGEICKNINILS